MSSRVDISRNTVPEGYSRGRSWLVVLLWWLVQDTLFRWSPRPAYGWRRWLLRLFGARLGPNVRIRPTVRVEFPWRLNIGEFSTIGDEACLYSLAEIGIGDHCVISQRAFLCTGSHDPDHPQMTLIVAPITVGDGAWLAADVFVAPGVEIGAETVVGARSAVFHSLPPGMVCYGSPCRPMRQRRLP
ncbi:MAG: colanic acid biosynthesis acetyltransferase WcaF [Armatimonadetes bacterium]|nr:colanic acid biosynthesis acetyltransferase WcaF [Armatimonadota bacterium]